MVVKIAVNCLNGLLHILQCLPELNFMSEKTQKSYKWASERMLRFTELVDEGSGGPRIFHPQKTASQVSYPSIILI